jgi:hypothetical protein
MTPSWKASSLQVVKRSWTWWGWNLLPLPWKLMRSKGFAAKCYQGGKGERCKYSKMVDLVGIEPTTSSMPWKRAPSCATGPRSKAKNAQSPMSWDRGKYEFIFAHIAGIVNASTDKPRRTLRITKETLCPRPSYSFVSLVVECGFFSTLDSSISFHRHLLP